MAGDDVTIVITANSGQAVRAFRDVNGQLRDMRGRFVAEGNAMSGAMNRVAASIGGVRGSIIPLTAAAAPLAAALAPIAAKAAGAGLAVGAFGAAVAGQISSLSEAAEAQKKYTDAVAQHGRGSQQAAEAARMVGASLAGMPYGTARAAVGFQTLKDSFQSWSDDISGFTMKPVTKSFAVLQEMIPKLTPMATGAADQLNRLVTVAGGAVSTPGFDALSEKVSTFANESLRDAVTGIIRFSTALAEGDANGPIKAFMDYATQNGPALRETLSNVGDAVVTLAQGAADAGPGMLTLVNAAAQLVAALPPELVTIAMQAAVGLKLMSLAGAGVAATAAGVGKLRDAMIAMGAASAAAGGGVAGARAAIGTLSTAMKGGLIAAGIVAVGLGVAKLAEASRGAPPDVDKLTTSLKNLARTGEFTGELKRAFGDIDGLVDDIGKVGQAAKDQEEYVQSFGNAGIKPLDDLRRGFHNLFDDFKDGEDSFKALEGRFGALDQSLASMVDGGYAKQAASDFQLVKDAALAQGKSLDEVNALFPEYQAAVAGAKAEQELAAQSMGIFGQSAQDTTAKLEAQQQSADGLRASILALNEVNRSAYDAQIGFEESLDALTASFAEHGATLNLDTEAGRANATAMSTAAKAQDELIASGLAAGESLGSMTQKSSELRESMMRLAVDAFDGNKQKATEYVNTLLGVPGDIKTLVKLEREEAIAGLQGVQAEIDKTPGKKSVRVDTLNGAAIAALEAVGLKTRRLPDGRTEVFTANGKALGNIGSVNRALNNLNGKTVNTYINTTYTKEYRTFRQGERDFTNRAQGGPIVGGSGVRDDVPILAMGGEYVINKKSTQKYGPLLEAINEDRLPRFAKGGKVSDSEKTARKELAGFTSLSYFSRNAGFRNNEFIKGATTAGSVGELVGVMNQMASLIKKASHGRAEQRALRAIGADGSGNPLWRYQRNLESVNKSLEKAKGKLDSLKDSAAQLSSSVKSGILSGANITKAAGAEDSQVTINTLLSQMTGSAANSKQFAGMLKTLKGRGLRGDLIEQIAEAGIEGGGMETAAAVLGGGKNEIKRLNELQRQITANASAAGKTTADAMYGVGIKAAEGLVKGLTKEQDKIEATMMRIAKSMEKAIKRALGIRSPSKVMEQVGDYTAEGFAVGMKRNRSVTPAWASMLNAPRGGTAGVQRTAVPSGGSGQDRPLVLNVSLGGREFGQIWVDVGRKEVKTRGGLKAALGGLD